MYLKQCQSLSGVGINIYESIITAEISLEGHDFDSAETKAENEVSYETQFTHR